MLKMDWTQIEHRLDRTQTKNKLIDLIQIEDIYYYHIVIL